MTRSALFTAFAAALTISVAACGGGSESGAETTRPAPGGTAPVASSAPEPAAAPAAPSAALAPGNSAAPAPAPPVADPCADVTDEYLITTLRMTGTPRYPLARLEQARCSGSFASAMSHPEGTLHPVMYLFEYSERDGHTHWRVIDVGEGLDCVNRHGVPAAAGAAIGCAS
ncbi:hypothetical protein [Nocardia wallacei]|nr:hypothetical protein [Nocardia wallacei]